MILLFFEGSIQILNFLKTKMKKQKEITQIIEDFFADKLIYISRKKEIVIFYNDKNEIFYIKDKFDIKFFRRAIAYKSFRGNFKDFE